MKNLAALTLSDGITYGVAAADPEASSLVTQLIQTMQMSQDRAPDRLLWVRVDGDAENHDAGEDEHPGTSSRADAAGAAQPISPPLRFSEAEVKFIHCAARHLADGDARAVQLMRVSQAVVSPAWSAGALLVHGALIERDGGGVLLAGPGGVGKSTASERIPRPWRAVCDDSALVVCDRRGAYWAHPWPTWSTFMDGGAGGRWDVGQAVRLRAIFFLEQAEEDRAVPVGGGEAVCLLLESVEQAMRASMHGMDAIEKRALHLQRFENVARLMKNVAGYRLSVCKSGAFWGEIERALEFDRKDNSKQRTADS